MLSPSTKPAPPRNTRKPPFLKQGRRLAYRLRFTIYFGRLVPLIAPARKKPALSTSPFAIACQHSRRATLQGLFPFHWRAAGLTSPGKGRSPNNLPIVVASTL